MAEVLPFPAGGYRFIKGPFQYSAGVAAEPGFEIERARFRRPVPIEEGFRAIEAYLNARGLAPTAFCACELRSPEPFTEEGFKAFNRVYVGTLERWGLFKNEVNPVARSNVCPELDKPPAPSFHAFSYTVPASAGAPPSFITAGSGEAAEGPGSYRERIVRYGDTSPAGHAREGALGARRAGAADGGARRRLGGRPPRRRSTRSTTSTRSSPRRSSRAVRCTPV